MECDDNLWRVYFLVPKLAGRPLYSVTMANAHFWLALAGTMLYIISMWAAGVSQGLLWLSLDDLGGATLRV